MDAERSHSAAGRRQELENRQAELSAVSERLGAGRNVGPDDTALARRRADEAAERAERARTKAAAARRRAMEAHRAAAAMADAWERAGRSPTTERDGGGEHRHDEHRADG